MSLHDRPVNESSAPARILLVDDSARQRTMLATLLGGLGFECCEAPDGAEAFDLFMRDTFALVITDLEMPRVDGFQLLAAVNLLPAWRRPPVIVLSAGLDEPARRARPELRLARAMLPKPVDTKALLRAVADVLDAAHTGQRRRR